MAAIAAPPAGPAGQDIGSAGPSDAIEGLGDVLSQAWDDAAAQFGESEEPAQPESGDAPDLGDLTGPEPADQAAAGTAQAKPAQPAATDPYPLSPDGKAYLVPKAELAQVQAARAFHEGVSRIFPTTESAQSAYGKASDFRMMENDWMNGSAASIDDVLSHWAGRNHADNPAVQAQYARSFAVMAQRMPEMLKQTNPQAYRALLGGIAQIPGTLGADGQITWGDAVRPASGLLLDAVEIAYGNAAQTQNPMDLRRAQELDYAVTGTFKEQLPRLDPQAQARADFEARERAFNTNQLKAEARDANSWNQERLEGAKYKLLDQEIDAELKGYRERSGINDVQYGDLKAGILRDLIGTQVGKLAGKLAAADPEWATLHEQEFRSIINDFRTTWKQGAPGSGLEARVQSYIRDFLGRARRQIPAIVKSRIETGPKPAAKRTAPRAPSSSPAAPPNSSPNGDSQKRPSEVAADWWNEQWNGIRAAL
jgi:hypothetical protein